MEIRKNFLSVFIICIIDIFLFSSLLLANTINTKPYFWVDDQTDLDSMYANWVYKGDGFLPSRHWKCEFASLRSGELLPEFVVEEKSSVFILLVSSGKISKMEILLNDSIVYYNINIPEKYTSPSWVLKLQKGRYRIKLYNKQRNKLIGEGRISIYFKSAHLPRFAVDTTQFTIQKEPTKYEEDIYHPTSLENFYLNTNYNHIRIKFSASVESLRVNAYLIKLGNNIKEVVNIHSHKSIPLTINAQNADIRDCKIFCVKSIYYRSSLIRSPKIIANCEIIKFHFGCLLVHFF